MESMPLIIVITFTIPESVFLILIALGILGIKRNVLHIALASILITCVCYYARRYIPAGLHIMLGPAALFIPLYFILKTGFALKTFMATLISFLINMGLQQGSINLYTALIPGYTLTMMLQNIPFRIMCGLPVLLPLGAIAIAFYTGRFSSILKSLRVSS